MELVLHPKVYSDIDQDMEYYERVATPELADEFYAELRYFMHEAAARPESFSICERDPACESSALSLPFSRPHRR